MKLGSCQLPPGPTHPESARLSAALATTRATYHRRHILLSDPPSKGAVLIGQVAVLVCQVTVLVGRVTVLVRQVKALVGIHRGRSQGAILERQPDAYQSALG